MLLKISIVHKDLLGPEEMNLVYRTPFRSLKDVFEMRTRTRRTFLEELELHTRLMTRKTIGTLMANMRLGMANSAEIDLTERQLKSNV